MKKKILLKGITVTWFDGKPMKESENSGQDLMVGRQIGTVVGVLPNGDSLRNDEIARKFFACQDLEIEEADYEYVKEKIEASKLPSVIKAACKRVLNAAADVK